jgi:hypothetical protein
MSGLELFDEAAAVGAGASGSPRVTTATAAAEGGAPGFVVERSARCPHLSIRTGDKHGFMSGLPKSTVIIFLRLLAASIQDG